MWREAEHTLDLHKLPKLWEWHTSSCSPREMVAQSEYAIAYCRRGLASTKVLVADISRRNHSAARQLNRCRSSESSTCIPNVAILSDQEQRAAGRMSQTISGPPTEAADEPRGLLAWLQPKRGR